MVDLPYDPFSYGFGNDDHFREVRAKSPEFRDFAYALGLLPVEWWSDYTALRVQRVSELMLLDARLELEDLLLKPKPDKFFDQLSLWD